MTSSSSSASKQFAISMQPIGRRAVIESGMNLLQAAQTSGVEVVSLCGGIGACDSCKIRLVKGKLSPLSLEEQAVFTPDELEAGYRLACQAVPLSDITIDIPPESLTTPQRLQVEGQNVEVALNPAVVAVDVQIDPPNLYDLRADTTRLNDALTKAAQRLTAAGKPLPIQLPPRYNYRILADLSSNLRAWGWAARLAVRGDEVIAALPPRASDGTPTPLLGLAVDIGTTKLAAYLIDLSDGQTLAKTGAMNPQIAYGEDVVSRIAAANVNPEGQKILQSRLVSTLNDMVVEMCKDANRSGFHTSPQQIVDAVIVGNTAMHHLFAGLPVAQLGASPYVPAVSEALDLPAFAVGLDLAEGAYIHLPPNIAGYVGADHVAMVLATLFTSDSNAPDPQRTIVALDIGTNTEITLAHRGRMLCCSCASGPAFEGAHIQDGMRAAPGAVERVQISGETLRIHTIGDQPPVGICGSGILDSISEMLNAGVLDYRGILQKNNAMVHSENSRSWFMLAPAETSGHGRDVVITRKDVNEIQLAKGAIRSGLEILFAEAGLSPQEIEAGAIDEFIVAGAFGTYISVQSAIRVGMFPNLPLERFHQVGNAAGSGARQMLVSIEKRRLAQEISRRDDYIELSAHPDFTSIFSKALFFPTGKEAASV